MADARSKSLSDQARELLDQLEDASLSSDELTEALEAADSLPPYERVQVEAKIAEHPSLPVGVIAQMARFYPEAWHNPSMTLLFFSGTTYESILRDAGDEQPVQALFAGALLDDTLDPEVQSFFRALLEDEGEEVTIAEDVSVPWECLTLVSDFLQDRVFGDPNPVIPWSQRAMDSLASQADRMVDSLISSGTDVDRYYWMMRRLQQHDDGAYASGRRNTFGSTDMQRMVKKMAASDLPLDPGIILSASEDYDASIVAHPGLLPWLRVTYDESMETGDEQRHQGSMRVLHALIDSGRCSDETYPIDSEDPTRMTPCAMARQALTNFQNKEEDRHRHGLPPDLVERIYQDATVGFGQIQRLIDQVVSGQKREAYLFLKRDVVRLRSDSWEEDYWKSVLYFSWPAKTLLDKVRQIAFLRAVAVQLAEMPDAAPDIADLFDKKVTQPILKSQRAWEEENYLYADEELTTLKDGD